MFSPKKEAELAWFEQQHGIQLPEGYRTFLLRVTNGGAGPFYGLLRLESGRVDDIDYPDAGRLLDPSQPFPHTEPWNLENTSGLDHAEFETEYFAPKWANGLLRIANYGCGISVNLVVNGPDYGKIWVDDRANDGGFYPDHLLGNQQRIEFLDWYELWLDQSIAEVRSKSSITSAGGRAPSE